MEHIELQTNDETTILRMVNIKKFHIDGYSCELQVRSGGFSCQRPFYFDDSHFPDAIDSLRRMNSGCNGDATIKARWEQDWIRLESNDLGHVFVTGELFELSDLPQTFKFGFRTDQTVLGPLICAFESLLNA